MRYLIFLIPVLFFSSSNLYAEEQCKALEPTNPESVNESFKGSMEGKIGGLVSRLAGATGNLEGEYKRLENDTLDKLSDNHRLYVWQRALYLACIKPDSGIDINKLLELYLTGPPKDES